MAQSQEIEVSVQGKAKTNTKHLLRMMLRICLGIILLGLLVWVIYIGWHAFHLYQTFKKLPGDPSQVEVSAALPLISEVAVDVGAIHGALRPLYPIFNALEFLPGIGSYLSQVEPLLTYANGISQAGKEALVPLEPLLTGSHTGAPIGNLPERLTLVLQAGEAHFAAAADWIDRASLVRSQIRPDILPEPARQMYQKLDGRFHLLAAGVQMLRVAPRIAGLGETQNYLVLAQNRDELRATGGFISGIGLVSVQDGRIVEFSLGDSYAIDDFSKTYPSPPEPLKRFMLADYWVTRDANWSPDFPTAAQETQSLYTLSTGIQTQGVIAFNQLALRSLLMAIGPVQVPGTDEPITAGNVEEYMRQAWAPAPDEGLSDVWWLHRKDFMQLFGGVILEKALSISDQTTLLDMAKTVVEMLDQGQILLYFNDPTAQSSLEKAGWDGGLHPAGQDYLYLVDSNIGFNKVDSVIQRSLAYHVDLSDPSHPRGMVTLVYQHTGQGGAACKQEISYGEGTYLDMQERCYLDYWRVYVPSGAELLGSTAQAVPADQLLSGNGWSGEVESLAGESGTQAFAGLLMLPIAQGKEITVSYSLPASVVQAISDNGMEYSLRVQVQPGLEGLPVQVEVRLPRGTEVTNPGEGWTPGEGGSWGWQGVLNKSKELKLAIQMLPQH